MRINLPWFTSALIVFASVFFSQNAVAGTITGKVIGTNGLPIQGVKLSLAMSVAQPSWASGAVITGPVVSIFPSTPTDGSFTFSSIADGSYRICANSMAAGLLNPCHWGLSVPTVTLTGGQTVTGVVVSMPSGGQIRVRVVDASAFVSRTVKPDPNLLHVYLDRKEAPFPLILTASDAKNLDYSISVPFDTPVSLALSSKTLSVVDSQGLQVPNGLFQQSFTATQKNPQINLQLSVSSLTTGK